MNFILAEISPHWNFAMRLVCQPEDLTKHGSLASNTARARTRNRKSSESGSSFHRETPHDRFFRPRFNPLLRRRIRIEKVIRNLSLSLNRKYFVFYERSLRRDNRKELATKSKEETMNEVFSREEASEVKRRRIVGAIRD